MEMSERASGVGALEAPVTTAKQDLVTTATGLWMVLGLFADGWAHVNLPRLESFFTPWHAVLYSGFGATAAWIAVLRWRNRRSPGGRMTSVWPRGYGLGALGVVAFGVGGVGDLLWHVAFGVEVGLEALLSPTHLVLALGGALVLSAPLRAGWARAATVHRPSLRAELPAVLSLTLVTALAAFFLLYVSVFGRSAVLEAPTQIPEGVPGHEAAEASVVAGLASYVITTVLFVAPLLLAERARRRPRGAAFVLIFVISWLSAAVTGSSGYAVITAAAITVAAAVLEVSFDVVTRSRLPRSVQMSLVGALVPAALWSAQIVALAAGPGLAWPPELWAGVIGLTVLVAAALGAVVGWTPARDRVVAVSLPTASAEWSSTPKAWALVRALAGRSPQARVVRSPYAY